MHVAACLFFFSALLILPVVRPFPVLLDCLFQALSPEGLVGGRSRGLRDNYLQINQELSTMSMPNSSDNREPSGTSPDEITIPAGVDRRSFLMRNAVIGLPL